MMSGNSGNVGGMPELVADQAERYPMEERKGYALVINNKRFEGTEAVLVERRGSHVDVQNFKRLFQTMGFIVETYEDLPAYKIRKVVEDMKNKINSENPISCFVCCVMTHGAMGWIYGSDSKLLHIGEILDPFKKDKCPALKGKPKVFLIQACRVDPKPTGALPATRSPGSNNGATPVTTPEPLDAVTSDIDYDNENDSAFRQYASPSEADFIVGYSLAPEEVSFRSNELGTWPVAGVVDVFSKYHENYNVNLMLLKVNEMVSEEHTKRGNTQSLKLFFTNTKKLFI